jgi:hypothetical protein
MFPVRYELDVYIVSCMSDYRRGFGLDIQFIDYFNTQLVITLNYSAIADFHPLQITRAQAKSFPVCSVFTSKLPGNGSNNCYSCDSVLKSSLNGSSLPAAFYN